MSRPGSKTLAPDEECIALGAKHYFEIDRGRHGLTGKISDERGTVLSRYAPRTCSSRGWANPFKKPDFVVKDAESQAELLIRRASFIPPVFHIIVGDKVIGRVCMISPLRNKYLIDIGGVNRWTFRMPLFTARFYGDSGARTDVWVAVGPSEMAWSVLIRPGINDKRLVAALAFTHNERWNYA
jgi:hypothetical protein